MLCVIYFCVCALLSYCKVVVEFVTVGLVNDAIHRLLTVFYRVYIYVKLKSHCIFSSNCVHRFVP